MSNRLRHAPVVVALLLFVALPLLADGMPIKNGRFQGKVSVIKLTLSQRHALSDKNRTLTLTKRQRRLLLAEAGVAPSQLLIYFTKDGENDCVCFAWNLGLLYQEGRIEVPHKYLISDEEAAERQKELDSL